MSRLIALLIGLSLIIACKTSHEKNRIIPSTTNFHPSEGNVKDTIIKLDYFDILPKEFGLAGDYYTYDTTEFSINRCIFLSDLTAIASIKIDGQIILLKLDSINNKQLTNGYYQQAWKSQDYIVLTKLKNVKEVGDEIHCEGTIEVITRRWKTVLKVHGETVT